MSCMTGLCFVDANVLIYARDPRDRAKQARAEQWIRNLFIQRCGRTSTQVLSEFYVVATRKLSPRVAADAAWDFVQDLMQWNPQPIDGSLLLRAREIEQRWRISWWDSMVVAAAQLQDCAILLTEDLQDGAVLGTVTVRNPFTFEVREPAASYGAGTALASLHRPRGRPRRTALA